VISSAGPSIRGPVQPHELNRDDPDGPSASRPSADTLYGHLAVAPATPAGRSDRRGRALVLRTSHRGTPCPGRRRRSVRLPGSSESLKTFLTRRTWKLTGPVSERLLARDNGGGAGQGGLVKGLNVKRREGLLALADSEESTPRLIDDSTAGRCMGSGTRACQFHVALGGLRHPGKVTVGGRLGTAPPRSRFTAMHRGRGGRRRSRRSECHGINLHRGVSLIAGRTDYGTFSERAKKTRQAAR